jgi:brefeldin A-inhibited guanine nucleotide-exchange protein
LEKETWPPSTTTGDDNDNNNNNNNNTIHPAIQTTIDAYKSVLTHPDATKVYKPSELALIGITLLVKKWYLVGRADGADESSSEKKEPSILQQVLEVVAKTSESQDIGIQTALIDTMTAIATSPKCEIHENALLIAVRSTFHVYLVSKKQSCKDVAKRAVLDMLKAVFVRMEAHDAMLNNNNTTSTQQQQQPQPNTNKNNNTNPTGGLPTQYHLDAYSLFRSFCKLSSKELPADDTDEQQLSLSGHSSKAKELALFFNTNIPTDPTELQSKILSLELILHVFTEFGESLVGHDKFLTLVQHYVSGSLLKNCVSNHTQVAFLSQNIFLVLVRRSFGLSFAFLKKST